MYIKSEGEGERNKLVVWGVGTSRTMRVHWLLHELGLEYENMAADQRNRLIRFTQEFTP